jgi:hypothetical protein
MASVTCGCVFSAASLRNARTLCPIGGIQVEYKGGTIPPPDQRRSYS